MAIDEIRQSIQEQIDLGREFNLLEFRWEGEKFLKTRLTGIWKDGETDHRIDHGVYDYVEQEQVMDMLMDMAAKMRESAKQREVAHA